MNADRILGQALAAVAPADLAAQDGADRTMHVAYRQDDIHGLFGFEGLAAQRQNRGHVERLRQAMVLGGDLTDRYTSLSIGAIQDTRKIETACLPVLHRLFHADEIEAANHLFHGAEPQARHELTHLLGNEAEKIFDMLRLAAEFFAQLRILCGNADRAGVEVAHTHHDATHHHERRRREAVFLRAHEGGDHHIAAGLHLTVHLHHNAVAQFILHQHLLRLGQSQFPGQTGVLERGQRARARASIKAGDKHHVGMSLGHARGDGADTDLGHELHMDARPGIGVLQVINKLRQILNRINIVVRWRRNQAHARGGVAHARDPWIHLVAGELATLAGLGPLRHLDLDVVAADKVMAGHAETS